MRAIVRLATRVYRKNPVRPHCDAIVGRHVLLCRMMMQQEHCNAIADGPRRGDFDG